MTRVVEHNRGKMAVLLAMLQWFQIQEKPLINHHLSLSLIVLIFSLFIFARLNRFWATEKLRVPPSPLKLPVIGHLHYLGTLPHRSLQALSQRYGPLMLVHLGFHPTLVVSSAEMAREIMKTHDIVFSSRPVVKASREFLCGGKDIVFAPYGDHWRHMRKLCATNLFSARSVQSFRDVTGEEMTIMVNKIKGLSFLREKVNLSDLVPGVTNNIITRTAMGRSLEQKEGAKIIYEVARLFNAFSFEDLFPSLGWIDSLTGLTRRMKKTSKQAHSLIDEVIKEHLASKADRKDLVDILLECEKDSTPGIEFTRENIRSVVLDIFAAGTETSYVTVEWAMAELLSHPHAMKKLQEEVRRVVGGRSKLEEDDINQMVYLTCVIKETLRLHPPLVLSIPRESTHSANVSGYHVPAKTRVLINLWAISRDPKVWDRPNEFIPERFVNSSVDFKGSDFEFIPFGAGRRGCPGLTFGIIMVESILANLLYWFDWKLHGSANNMDVDMTEAFGVSVRMKNALHLVPVSHFT